MECHMKVVHEEDCYSNSWFWVYHSTGNSDYFNHFNHSTHSTEFSSAGHSDCLEGFANHGHAD